MKYILLALPFLFVLSACEKGEEETTPVVAQKQEMKQEQKQEKQKIKVEVTEEKYTVDKSDMIQEDELILDIEASEIDEKEEAGLILMREEEKLAHDVYRTLGEKWGQKIFFNIADSEYTHTNAVKVLLERYNVEDPVTTEAVGVFTSSDMQNLYNTLVEQGEKSLLDALIVGATVEDLDIKDLEDLLAETDNQDIINTYSNLQRGSRNHMRAFVKNITRQGGEYTPQYISAEEYEAIIEGEQERGNGGGHGGMNEGGGRGQGNGGEMGRW